MRKNWIRTVRRIAALVLCLSMLAQLPAAAESYGTGYETSEGINLLDNPGWEKGTEGWDVTAYNESGEWEGTPLLHSVISQDVPLDTIADRQDLLLKYSGSIAVTAGDAAQRSIYLELSFYDSAGELIRTEGDNFSDSENGLSQTGEDSFSGGESELIQTGADNSADSADGLVQTEADNSAGSCAVYEYSPSLTYHEIILDIPENAAYAKASLGIWKDSRQNQMYFEDLCLETVRKIDAGSFYRSAASTTGNFRRSAGASTSSEPSRTEIQSESEPGENSGTVSGTPEQSETRNSGTDSESEPGEPDGNEETVSSDNEPDPEMMAMYEEWEVQVLSENEGPFASDLPAFGEAETIYVMEDGLAQLSNGVTVDFSDSLEIGDQALLCVRKTPTVTDEELGADYQVYDITLGDLHELDGYIEIRLPYDDSHIEAGQDPAKCVAGMYLNESTGQWEPVPYEVDTDTKELILHTSHLSFYGCFSFVNEGKRSARITTIAATHLETDPEKCLKALQEITESGGIPGPACRELTKPYLEDFLTEYFQSSVSNTADLATRVGNIATMLVAAVPGLENYLDKNPLPYGLNQALGKAGLAISIVSLATMMFKEDKTDHEILSMYKDAAYLLASLSGEATLGTIGASVWVIDYALTDMGNYAYSTIKENLTKAYRHYMTTNNKWHGKPRTLKEWRTILKQAARDAIKNSDNPEDAIMDEIDRYCNEFWTLPDDVLAEVYDNVGLNGRGLPDAATRQAISNEFKGELMDSLQSVVRAVQKDLYWELEEEEDKRLEKVRKLLNTVITFEIREKAVKEKEAQYAGYTAAFAPLNETADKEDWKDTINKDGSVTIQATYIAWLVAGEPNEIQLYGPGKKIGIDKPEKTVSFDLSVPKTIIDLGNDSIDDFMGKWYYKNVEIVDEEHAWKRTTTEVIEFVRDGDTVTMYDQEPVTMSEYEGSVTYSTDFRGDMTMTGTYSIDQETGNFLFHVQSVTLRGETHSYSETMEFHLVDENHLAMSGPGTSEYEPEILTRSGTED